MAMGAGSVFYVLGCMSVCWGTLWWFLGSPVRGCWVVAVGGHGAEWSSGATISANAAAAAGASRESCWAYRRGYCGLPPEGPDGGRWPMFKAVFE